MRGRSRDSSVKTDVLPYFFAGDENRLISFISQSEMVIELSQPILLLGPVGCGKSSIAMHLAAMLATSLHVGGDVTAVRAMEAVDFARDYATAVDADDLPPLRESLDSAPVVLIDDLQAIAGKNAAQDELAVRVDRRTALGKPTILVCKRLPSETRGIRPQLASRCVMGLTVPIQLPSNETQRVILRELMLQRDLNVSEDLVGLLTAGLRGELSVPALTSSVKQIELYCRMNGCNVNVAAIQAAINANGDRNSVDLSRITRTVAKILGQRTKDLRSGSRKQSVVRARSLAMLLARQLTSYSLDAIGDYFGGRDHSTVLHAIRKTETLLAQDAELNRMMHEATEKLAA
ncbi:MAG: helix-turn-helix domain-containing protein [Planctomycetota bacterium]